MQPEFGTQQDSRTVDAAARRDLDLLRHEVARLRREARSARLLAGLATVGLAFGLFAMKNPEILPLVQTKRLEIVDDAGRVALVASTSPQGGRLDLWNAAGANTASAPHSAASATSLSRVRGYFPKSSCGANWVGLTKTVATTGSPWALARRISDPCPSCSAPIVGTRAHPWKAAIELGSWTICMRTAT